MFREDGVDTYLCLPVWKFLPNFNTTPWRKLAESIQWTRQTRGDLNNIPLTRAISPRFNYRFFGFSWLAVNSSVLKLENRL